MAKGNAGESARVTPRLDPEMEGIVDRESLDPQYHYRFIQDRPQRIARMKSKGYSFVSATEDGVKILLEDSPADDKIRDGDAILMKVPKDRHEAGRKKVAAVTRGRMAAPTAQFRKKAQGAGPGGADVAVTTDTKE